MNARATHHGHWMSWAAALLSLFVVAVAQAYNKSWDQGHNVCVVQPGTSNWGKFDKAGKFHGTFASKECCEACCKVCPVYANSGQLQETFTDLALPGNGPTLEIRRTYSSQDWATSFLGNGWTFNFGKRLIVARSSDNEKMLGLLLETGEQNYYKENLDGSLERLTGYGPTFDLVKNSNGTYTITNRDGSRTELFADGKIDRILDRNGKALSFQYNSTGCVSRITNASGNFIDFSLGPNGKIASATDNFGRTIAYGYDDAGNLISVTDPLGNSVRYTYNSDNLLTQRIDARGNVVETIAYDTNQPPRVASFVEKGETFTISYFADRTEKTDAHGNTWTYYYNDVGVITRMVDPAGNEAKDELNKITATTKDWEEDANGNRTTYTLDAEGNILTETDAVGNRTIYTYVAGTNWPASETDPLGVVTIYGYDAQGNLLTVTQDAGGALAQTTAYTYDSAGNRTSETDPLGKTTTYEYDAIGNLSRTTDPDGNVTNYGYDAFGNRTSETDPLGNIATFEYDLLGRLTKLTRPSGQSKGYSRDAEGNLAAFTDFNGNRYQYEYDQYNRITKVTYPDGLVRTKTYTSPYQVTSTDRCGTPTTNYYDVRGLLIKSERGAGLETVTWEYGYDPAGNLTSAKDPYGRVATRTYDALNRLSAITDAAGNTTTYTYTPLGQIATESRPGGNVVAHTYDSLGQLTSTQDSIGPIEAFTYDSGGHVIAEANALGDTTSYTYDAAGNVATRTDPKGQTTRFEYDAAGNLVVETDRMGTRTDFVYNGDGQLASQTNALGPTISYAYDGMGNLRSVADPVGNTTQYGFDALNQLASVTYPDGTTQRYTYHCSGNLASITDPSGDVVAYEYDGLGRRTKVDYPGANDSTFTFDMLDRMRTAQNDLGIISFDYDTVGNIASTTQFGRTVQQSINPVARTRTLNYPGGGTAMEVFDLRGRIVEVEDGAGQTLAAYSYDNADNLKRRDINGAIRVDYVHDPNGWVSRTTAVVNATPAFDREDTYDPEGNLTLRRDHLFAGRSERFDYDAIQRLTGHARGVVDSNGAIPSPVARATFEYDGAGNRTRRTENGLVTAYAVNSVNGYTQVGTLAYSYDGDGSLTTGRQNYAYTPGEGLTEVRDKTSGATLVAFEYDALERRAAKTAGGVLTQYVFEGNSSRIVEELQDTVPDVWYIYGAESNELLSRVAAAGRHWFQVDALGSPQNVWDDSSTLRESYLYKPFGDVSVLSPSGTGLAASAIGNTRFYLGLPLDSASSLYELDARMYDPEDGRFLRFDPIGYTDSNQNLYQYALNNPLKFYDPSGLIPVSVKITSPAKEKSLQNDAAGVTFGVTDTGDAVVKKFDAVLSTAKTGKKCCSVKTCKNYDEETLSVKSFKINVRWPIWYDTDNHKKGALYFWRDCNGTPTALGYLPGSWSKKKPASLNGENWIKVTAARTIVHERTHSITQGARSIKDYFNGIAKIEKTVCNPTKKENAAWKKEQETKYKADVLSSAAGMKLWVSGGAADETEADNAMCP